MRIVAAAFAVLVPGGGAILRRRYFLAAGILIVFLAVVQAWVLARVIHPAGVPGWTGPLLLAGAIAIWAANAAFEVYEAAGGKRHDAANRVAALYSEALGAYISADDEKAEGLLRSAMRIDGLDADLLFLRAQAAAHRGDKRRAGRLFRKCMDFDEKGKWGWEARTALKRL
jgi:hypothetical protein